MDRVHSLHRLDVSNRLFYPSRAQAQAAAAAAEAAGKNARLPKLATLPAPAISFHPLPKNLWINSRLELFALLNPDVSDDESTTAGCSAPTTRATRSSTSPARAPAPPCREPLPVQADAAHRGLRHPPRRRPPAGARPLRHARARLGTDFRAGGFEVLKFGAYGDDSAVVSPWCANAYWRWETLPPPPFIDDPDYEPGIICSHAVAEGGRTICFSSAAHGVGTYCFDTVTREWRRAGDWVLPFDGKALYVPPELGLWLGFSRGFGPKDICAVSDLDSALRMTAGRGGGGEARPPEVKYALCMARSRQARRRLVVHRAAPHRSGLRQVLCCEGIPISESCAA